MLNGPVKHLLIVILMLNTIIWCFVPRETYCGFVQKYLAECPSHGLYLVVGLISFVAAVVIAQYDYIKTKMN
jgi:hypothetical protein